MEENDLKGKKILLAEDDEMFIFILRRYLRKLGFDFTVTRNGQQAIDLVRINKFDIVIMDFGLPILSGLEAARIIKTELGKKFANLPIIGFSGVDEIEPSYSEYFNGFISKNVNQPEMLEKLSAHLK
ncbi:MAG: response regulator [Cyclobacteriaceae bacterium]